MTSENNAAVAVWKFPLWLWAIFFALGVMAVVIFYDGLKRMVEIWSVKEEYGYGYLIPFITIFLIWQKAEPLVRKEFRGAWTGTAVTLFGIAFYFLGELSALYIIVQYAFVIVIAGLFFSFLGWQAFKLVWAPLLLLIFMIPLPNFLYQGLSAQLQLISSELGVMVIRLMGISVFLEGNVIDLGSFKLQVVEACSGLRYLFPLATLAFLASYLYKGELWKKAVIFLSSVPITVLMNSFRIGMIGVLVEYGGISMAQGFLHYFEGWVIFMVCLAILVAEMWLLANVGGQKLPWREAFGIELPARTPKDAPAKFRTTPTPFWGAALLLAIVVLPANFLDKRAEISPARADFSGFPMTLGTWHGKVVHLEALYLDVLKLDDYLLADFVNTENKAVNLYVAYYASQSKGESVHSPRSCIPGGGWQIKDITQKALSNIAVNDRPFIVNRAVIQKGDSKQLVYYWFQQRGRNITNEYLVKWYLFWDALTRNRTDGALVRLVAFVQPGQDMEEADIRLSQFAKLITPQLSAYIPE